MNISEWKSNLIPLDDFKFHISINVDRKKFPKRVEKQESNGKSRLRGNWLANTLLLVYIFALGLTPYLVDLSSFSQEQSFLGGYNYASAMSFWAISLLAIWIGVFVFTAEEPRKMHFMLDHLAKQMDLEGWEDLDEQFILNREDRSPKGKFAELKYYNQEWPLSQFFSANNLLNLLIAITGIFLMVIGGLGYFETEEITYLIILAAGVGLQIIDLVLNLRFLMVRKYRIGHLQLGFISFIYGYIVYLRLRKYLIKEQEQKLGEITKGYHDAKRLFSEGAKKIYAESDRNYLVASDKYLHGKAHLKDFQSTSHVSSKRIRIFFVSYVVFLLIITLKNSGIFDNFFGFL